MKLWETVKQKLGLCEPMIKVGILHSLSGPLAIGGRAVADATLLAIEEINQHGGLLGRKIKAIVADGASNTQTFFEQAEKLINEDKVDVVFGCWASSNRKSVKPLFEKYNHLLIYPVQYEGLEQSPNIVYTGSAPNQQIIPAIKWAFDNLGKRFFLVGSDYIFSHSANAIIKDQASLLHAQILGEVYISLGSPHVKEAIDKIAQYKPDVVINTINGDTNIHFFKALRQSGILSKDIPTLSFSVSENEILSIGSDITEGDYAAWNYFQSIPSEINQSFIEKYKKHYGADRTTSDPIESGYFGVYLWAQAVTQAKTSNVQRVKDAIKGQSYMAPEGKVTVDPVTLHTSKVVRIGQINKEGQFTIVWNSTQPVMPIPFPAYRTKAEWEHFLNDLYQKWNHHWTNPS